MCLFSESIQCVLSNKLFTVISDGPSMSWNHFKNITNFHPNLFNTGECILHKVHNSFSCGLNAFGSDIENLAIDISYLLRRLSLQSSKLKDLQVKLDFPEEVFSDMLTTVGWNSRHQSCK